MVKSLENAIALIRKDLTLKDSKNTFFRSRIKELEISLEKTSQEVSLKDSDIASYKAKLKDQRESAGLLIFPLRVRVNEQQNELKRC